MGCACSARVRFACVWLWLSNVVGRVGWRLGGVAGSQVGALHWRTLRPAPASSVSCSHGLPAMLGGRVGLAGKRARHLQQDAARAGDGCALLCCACVQGQAAPALPAARGAHAGVQGNSTCRAILGALIQVRLPIACHNLAEVCLLPCPAPPRHRVLNSLAYLPMCTHMQHYATRAGEKGHVLKIKLTHACACTKKCCRALWSTCCRRTS